MRMLDSSCGRQITGVQNEAMRNAFPVFLCFEDEEEKTKNGSNNADAVC